MASFAVQTNVFEGPLELLLQLIEKRKLLINDVSLASVADEYMRYIEAQHDHPLAETAQFVSVASTLLLIKSRSLLPVLDLTDEEEKNIDDLHERLKLYQIFRTAGADIQKQFGKNILHERIYRPNTTPVFTPDARVTQSALRDAIHELLQNLPKKIFKKDVAVQKLISLEEMMGKLHQRVVRQFKMSFADFSGGGEKSEVIVSFLAVLELVKQGMVVAHQHARFADFDIEQEGVDTPKYG